MSIRPSLRYQARVHTRLEGKLVTIDAALDFAKATRGRKFATILADPPWRFTNRTGKMAPEHHRLSRAACPERLPWQAVEGAR